MKWIRIILIILLISGGKVVKGEKMNLENLPYEEKELLNTVDPWGLAFSDQLKRFQSYFENNKKNFVVGFTHNLVKIWQNKYWFRGKIVGKDEIESLWGVTGSTVSFQVVILPKIGAEKQEYGVNVKAPVKVNIYREIFVKVGSAPYVRFQSNFWPDPLIKSDKCVLGGIKAGVFLIEFSSCCMVFKRETYRYSN